MVVIQVSVKAKAEEAERFEDVWARRSETRPFAAQKVDHLRV